MDTILEEFAKHKAEIDPILKKLLDDDQYALALKVVFCYVQTYRLHYLKEKHNRRVEKHKNRMRKVFDELDLHHFNYLINERNFK